MRYSNTLDRVLFSLSLLREGDTKASAIVLAEALDAQEFEQDFNDLNELQQAAFNATASIEGNAPEDEDGEDSDDGFLASNAYSNICADSEQDGWDDVDCDDLLAGADNGDGNVDPESETVRASSDSIRRTKMMLDNLRAMRERV